MDLLFSLPVITLVAMILLMIMISLLNIIFFWLLWIKIRLPFPKINNNALSKLGTTDDSNLTEIMSWPLDGISEDGRFDYAKDEESVREVIRNILLTRPGERLRRRTFGAGITDFIHQTNNVTTRTLLGNVVKKAIDQWETRVILENVEVLPDPQQLSTVHIHIRYRMRHTRKMNQLTLSLDLQQI